MYYEGPTFLLLIAGIALAMWTQFKVKSTYKKFGKVRSQGGLTGAKAAERILAQSGVHGVGVEESGGFLSDHYDPRSRTVRLSPDTFRTNSLAALAVAAHECGHALQHAKGYAPLNFRHALLPVANLGSGALVWIMVLGGLFLGLPPLVDAGIVFFAGAVLFHVVTLPVEFNASSRALAILSNHGYLVGEENAGAKKVLNAAALTYVASATIAVLQLVRLLILRDSMRD
ncbi:MAG: peptidase [Gemmatimonadetes bacterium]|nr:peptidase [Gemmatimonadota bacterium]